MNVTDLKLLDHPTKFFSVLHTVDVVEIPTIYEEALHQCQCHPTIHQFNGNGAMKVQAGKTHNTGRAYARCGAEIATSIR